MTTLKAKKSTAKPAAIKKGADGRAKNGGRREGAGRPAFVPTAAERKQVEALAGYGLPHEQIAVLVRDGVNPETLRKYFGHELEVGKAKASAKVGQTLFQKATGGDTTAMIWWTKSQMKWSERVEVTGAEGGAVQTETAHKLPAKLEEALDRVLGAF